MTNTYKVSGMTCNGCAATVQRALASVKGVEDAKVSFENGSASVITSGSVSVSELQMALSNYSYQLFEGGTMIPHAQDGFWQDNKIWRRAALNTLNCLIGCSIGDLGMVLFLQAFYPGASMTVQMFLATAAGLITSVLMETVLLHVREKFNWTLALQTAFSMSFISMIAMELVMNATDFMITGGKASFGNPMYWTALIVAMVAGFLAPLPYNYFKLKKYNQACH